MTFKCLFVLALFPWVVDASDWGRYTLETYVPPVQMNAFQIAPPVVIALPQRPPLPPVAQRRLTLDQVAPDGKFQKPPSPGENRR